MRRARAHPARPHRQNTFFNVVFIVPGLPRAAATLICGAAVCKGLKFPVPLVICVRGGYPVITERFCLTQSSAGAYKSFASHLEQVQGVAMFVRRFRCLSAATLVLACLA